MMYMKPFIQQYCTDSCSARVAHNDDQLTRNAHTQTHPGRRIQVSGCSVRAAAALEAFGATLFAHRPQAAQQHKTLDFDSQHSCDAKATGFKFFGLVA